MVKILYFGRLSDRVGLGQEILDLPQGVDTIETLKTWLDEAHDLGGALHENTVKTMIDHALIHTDISLEGVDEIGFLPPVGGG